MPPGRAAGQRCERSRAETSAFVRGRGSPPYAETRERPPVVCGANTIESSETQAAPRGSGASQIVDRGSSRDGRLAELAACKEADPLPVRREEGAQGAVRLRHLDRDEAVEPPQVEARPGAPGRRTRAGSRPARRRRRRRRRPSALRTRGGSGPGSPTHAAGRERAARAPPQRPRTRPQSPRGDREQLLAPSLTSRPFRACYSGARHRVSFLRRVNRPE